MKGIYQLPQKLELNWIGKDIRPSLEPRILLEDLELSYHADQIITTTDIFDNRLILGDNLLALKALEQEFSGIIKCIYIDPPYNTGQAMEHYDDGIEHSTWLSLIRERLEVLRGLLRKDGVLICQLNDDEMAYAKVLLDEVFGRNNYLNHVCVRMKQTSGASGGGEDKRLKKNIEHILIYARDKDGCDGFIKFNDVYDEEDLFEVIEDMKSEGKSWKYTRVLISFGERQFLKTIVDGGGDAIDIYSHRNVIMKPISVLCSEEKISEEECYNKYFSLIFRDTNAQSSIRTRVMDATAGQGVFFSIEYTPRSGKRKGQKVNLYYKGANCDLIAWLKDVAVKRENRLVKLEKTGTYWEGFPLNNLTKEGGVQFPKGKKPEALIQKIIELCTVPGEWVLDSFGGSGTTGAVAHKMGRRWIMVELGDHIYTHIIPRMRRVITGVDQGGVTKAVGWKGGGGFRYYKLAPSLLETDKWGNWVISKQYNAAMLAEAMCKLEGFKYAPSETVFWRQGQSTESDFIYTTTQTLGREVFVHLSEEVGSDRTLLICCMKYDVDPNEFPNLTIRKIPSVLLGKCEFGRDDYSLEISNLPQKPPEAAGETDDGKRKRKGYAEPKGVGSLFDDGGEA